MSTAVKNEDNMVIAGIIPAPLSTHEGRSRTLDAGVPRDRPLREVVRDQIRQRINEGQYAPGTRLIERDLADEFDVSRLPVREALRMLREERLIADRPTGGLVVSELTRADVEELFDVREALERMSCSLAAQRATQDDLMVLKRLLIQAKEATQRQDIAAAREANGKFHDEIPRLAGNELLRSILDPLHGRLQWLLRQAEDLEGLCTEHDQLLDAIASGDAELAANAAERHVRSNRRSTLSALFHHGQ